MLSGLARAEGHISVWFWKLKKEDDVKQLTHLDSHNQIVSTCPAEFSKCILKLNQEHWEMFSFQKERCP